MLKEHRILFRRLMVFFDLCIVCFAFFVEICFNKDCGDFYKDPGKYIVIILIILVIWGALLYNLGMYESFRTKYITEVLLVVAETALIGGSFFGSLVFLLKLQDISRMQIFYSFLLASILISIEKVVLIRYFRYQQKKGINTRNILIVGTGKR